MGDSPKDFHFPYLTKNHFTGQMTFGCEGQSILLGDGNGNEDCRMKWLIIDNIDSMSSKKN
jgi:hypothetical protein